MPHSVVSLYRLVVLSKLAFWIVFSFNFFIKSFFCKRSYQSLKAIALFALIRFTDAVIVFNEIYVKNIQMNVVLFSTKSLRHICILISGYFVREVKGIQGHIQSRNIMGMTTKVGVGMDVPRTSNKSGQYNQADWMKKIAHLKLNGELI